MQLRPYQIDFRDDIYKAWSVSKNVLGVAFTGSGKTVVMSAIVKDQNVPTCLIAHRQELVSQISLTLARHGIRHRVIAPNNVIKSIIQIHLLELGKDFYDPASKVAVAGVDTLIRRESQLKDWLPTVKLWIIDESHHLLAENKWGKAVKMFPNAKGLGFTATPQRSDGKGLGSHADGLFDDMVIGPTPRWLIDQGYLTDYKIYAPTTIDLDLSGVSISKATGDYIAKQLDAATKKSMIVGNALEHYKKFAAGTPAVIFATSVETATDMAEEFNRDGIKAVVITGKTPDLERARHIKDFREGKIQVLSNVGIFEEGTDIPRLTTVIFARATASLGLYIQMFGRALRVVEGKANAIVIDMVGNVVRHGLVDSPRNWTLDRRDKRASKKVDDAIPVRACPECTMVYERTHVECPFCGFKPIPAERSAPEQVDGDLCELPPEVLAQMRGAVAEVDMDPEEYRLTLTQKHMPQIGQLAAMKRHRLRKEAQHELRETMKLWGGKIEATGKSTREAQKLFWFKYGIDVMSAMALGDKEAIQLKERIEDDL